MKALAASTNHLKGSLPEFSVVGLEKPLHSISAQVLAFRISTEAVALEPESLQNSLLYAKLFLSKIVRDDGMT